MSKRKEYATHTQFVPLNSSNSGSSVDVVGSSRVLPCLVLSWVFLMSFKYLHLLLIYIDWLLLGYEDTTPTTTTNESQTNQYIFVSYFPRLCFTHSHTFSRFGSVRFAYHLVVFV